MHCIMSTICRFSFSSNFSLCLNYASAGNFGYIVSAVKLEENGHLNNTFKTSEGDLITKCDGALLDFFKNGCMLKWLERLNSIE